MGYYEDDPFYDYDDDDNVDYVEESKKQLPPSQKAFELEPEYAVSETGTKHEFKGGLLVPTPEEIARIDQEQKSMEVANKTVVGLRIKKERVVVSMNGIEALWLRTGRKP